MILADLSREGVVAVAREKALQLGQKGRRLL